MVVQYYIYLSAVFFMLLKISWLTDFLVAHIHVSQDSCKTGKIPGFKDFGIYRGEIGGISAALLTTSLRTPHSF